MSQFAPPFLTSPPPPPPSPPQDHSSCCRGNGSKRWFMSGGGVALKDYVVLIRLSSCLMASMISSFTLCNSRNTSSKISCFILSRSNESVSLPPPAVRTLETIDLSAELARSHGFFAPSVAFCPLRVLGDGEFGSSFWLSSGLSEAAFLLRANRAFISSISPPLPPLVRLASFLPPEELSS